MARARNLKPGFFTNGDLIECQPLARLLFAGLWCEADRRGILEDRPKTIKVKVLPGDNCDIEELLTELSDRGFIRRYEVDGIRCIHIPAFGKHQNPHVKEQASTLPAPPEIGEHGTSTMQAPDKHGASPAESLFLDSLIPHPESGDTPQPPKGGERTPKKPDLRGFPEFWVAYPKKVAKGAAESAWLKLGTAERDAAIEAIQRQRSWPCFTQAPPDKQPHPATWLNARRWEDEPPQVQAVGVNGFHKFTIEDERAFRASNPMLRGDGA